MKESLGVIGIVLVYLVLPLTVFIGFAWALTVVAYTNRDPICKQQFGQDWRYVDYHGADCVNNRTGEGRFFKK